METSREDVGIVIRSAFLKKGTQQRFSLFALIVFSIILIYVETIDTKPLNYLRSFIKEGLILVGWVSMWKPINIFLYEWWPLIEAKNEL